MDTETPHAQENGFAQSPWMDMGGFHPSHQNSPPLDYHGFGYPVHVPLDASYGVTIPPPYAPPALPMTVPSNAWPSMLTTSSQPPFQQSEHPVAPVPIAPSVSPIAPVPPPRKSSTSSSTPRRTLTDDDRRRMCLYAEENKTAKQTDIGALFGVERSTVSKVLRQKDKYLNPEDGSRSPIKRAKGRVPDIEKALSNWVRNYQRGGHGLTDEMIREKALFFASTCGSDGKEKVLSNSWLEKFKQKNGLLGAKVRKGSFGAKSDSESPTGLSINSALASAVHSPSVLSPISPTGFVSPSALSPAQSHENIRGSISVGPTDLGIDFQHSHSRSTISLDTTASFSPTSTLLTESPFTPSSQSRISPTDVNSSRPRSQTFPIANADPHSMPTDDLSEPTSTMKGLLPAAMEDAVGDDCDQKVALNIDTSPGTIKRNRSNPDIRARTIYPPSYSRSTTVSPISSPGSPTQDEARKALELVVNYFEHQSSGLGAQEAVTIGKLLERLQLAQQPPTLPGGLTRIDEHDDASPPHQSSLTKKRSIHNMG
ncbi:hypothetical protein AN4077.2 [Aspergillus nidulans FGSC A4]|uniref:HTH CENPB-type domain-containing protein n=1 Tax=Emericella nidulans (strain FGSC A4 / ATCC 38163 / CBS 112.46 / NRRL 194 / M139) TaxID=227321 RepID=Q5B5V3_EMENI|nr:hypothetical protein [Aspergillus nidulans FGSC A4]EAA58965.1 hypothetical protein AN4077.2 [Aspergillus nidulans FGSC A4]CBF74754.1 TPA: conserved hypothetical protein [Aspergillus nidulans FGSC A4]|eukprot:XP_661681.1 hypothetical protein AN4077.2 [Aspergillus nidulans FGSC A4]